MKEIDLIPEEFLRKRLFQRWLTLAVSTAITLSVVLLGSSFYLYQANQKTSDGIVVLQAQRDISTENRKQLVALNLEKSNLKQQLNLLTGLRSGASAEQMFVTIDRALPGPDVWITDWKFRRAGTPVEDKTETVNTGYFIVIPAGSRTRKEETWKIDTKMKIRGQAMDHKAMSEFVINLTRQPEIEDVRIVSTRLTQVNRIKLVDFNLDIIVSSKPRSS